MTQAEVKGRLAEVEFSVSYADGTTSMIPVEVKWAEAVIGSQVVEVFRQHRGGIHRTGPGRYGVYLNPRLYTERQWFKIRWHFVHPMRSIETVQVVEYFFRSVPDLPDVGPSSRQTVSEVASIEEHRHLIAKAVIQRTAILLRRFNGSFVAIFLKKTKGVRCPDCWDFKQQRRFKSDCRTCKGAGMKAGYSRPIYGFVYHPSKRRDLSIGPLGEMKEQKSQEPAWTTPYPALSAGDFYVLQNGERWRIVPPVTSSKLEGAGGPQTVRQIFNVQRIDPDDAAMLVPVGDMRRPFDEFVGFMEGDTREGLPGVVFTASGIL